MQLSDLIKLFFRESKALSAEQAAGDTRCRHNWYGKAAKSTIEAENRKAVAMDESLDLVFVQAGKCRPFNLIVQPAHAGD